MDKLKECPFCGGKATFDHDDNGWYWIVCEKCGTATNSRTHTMEDCHPLLAEQWNRRVIPLHEMLDGCRKQFDDWWAEFTSAHEDWRFADSDALRWQAWQAAWNSRASPASVPEGFTMSEPAILPDGSGFGTMTEREATLLGKVERQSAALKLASLALSEGVEYVEEPPEKNCTCHLSPPCNDCVDHSAVREFFIDARKALAAIDALGDME